MKNLIIASTSTIHGSTYLSYIKDEIGALFQGIERLTFIPYARPGGISHDAYTEIAQKFFKHLDIKVKGLHEYEDPIAAIRMSQGIFTGGGNTFVLVNALHRKKLMQSLREAIFYGIPYLGTSAGSNICGVTMQTTNDMPIIYPPSFKTLGVIPCNINPHYLDPIAGSKHMGETRETRIKEFHTQNNIPVLGLREGSWLRVNNKQTELQGSLTARVFEAGKEAYEIESGTVIDTLWS